MDGMIELEDGRYISYREYGDPRGVPVIFYHGACNSRLYEPKYKTDDVETKQAGVRLIAIDRAGYGLSPFQHDRTYHANGAELDDLLDQLQIPPTQKIVLLGYSSGGPNALAAARFAECKDQIAAVGLVASNAPVWNVSARPRPAPLSPPHTRTHPADAPLQMWMESGFDDWMFDEANGLGVTQLPISREQSDRGAALVYNKLKVQFADFEQEDEPGGGQMYSSMMRDLDEATTNKGGAEPDQPLDLRPVAQDLRLERKDWGCARRRRRRNQGARFLPMSAHAWLWLAHGMTVLCPAALTVGFCWAPQLQGLRSQRPVGLPLAGRQRHLRPQEALRLPLPRAPEQPGAFYYILLGQGRRRGGGRRGGAAEPAEPCVFLLSAGECGSAAEGQSGPREHPAFGVEKYSCRVVCSCEDFCTVKRPVRRGPSGPHSHVVRPCCSEHTTVDCVRTHTRTHTFCSQAEPTHDEKAS